MSKMSVSFGRSTFRNPVFCASGCFGHGYELASLTDLSVPGAITLKTVTPEARRGNPPPRVWEVDAGIHSSIGLQNPGPDVFFRDTMPKVFAACRADQIIISIGGSTIEEYARLAARISALYPHGEIAAIEINASCPNTQKGAGVFCQDPDKTRALVAAVRAETDCTIIGKMNTNFGNYCEVAQAVESGGADALCTSNTPLGMVINLKTGRPALGNVKGPICGPAIRPFGVMKTWDIYKVVSLPIIAGGGIYTTEHALEYLMAGATALDVASAHFLDPTASVKIVQGLEAYIEEHTLNHIHDITGLSHRA